ncbi:MAG: hypothetical protein RL060_939 [Bacteroidota bacterium]
MKKTLTLITFVCSTLLAFSQQVGTIKGKLIEKTTQQPIVGGRVVVQNLSLGGSTDTSGIFTINNVPEGNQAIEITAMGYQNKLMTEVIVTRNKTNYLEIELLDEVITTKEVVVKSFKNENDPTLPVSTYSFSREEIFRNPGAQGDIFRAIGILPGVSSSGGQFSAIAVRGQGTSDNVYMVDDIPMFNLSHLEGSYGGFSDPNGGRFSIFAPRVINNATFQGGGFGAQYGRKSASYLGLSVKEGNKITPSVSGQFDLLGGTLIYDGPSYLHKKTSVFASARYQNFKTVLKMVGLENVGLAAYGDYMVKTTTEINAKNKLSLMAIYNPESFERNASHVLLSKEVDNTNLGNFTNSKSMFSLNLRTLTSHKSYWKNIAYYRQFDVVGTLGMTYPSSDCTSVFKDKTNIPSETDLRKLSFKENELGYRSIFTQHFNSSTLTAGIDLARFEINNARTLKHTDTLYSFTAQDIRPSPSQYFIVLPPQYFNAKFKNYAYNASAYVDYSFLVLQKLTLNTGLRYDYTGFTASANISPRLSGSFKLNTSSSINFATGIFYQDPSSGNISDNSSSTKKLKSEKTVQYILGFKKQLTEDLKFVVEAWGKQFDNLITRPYSGQKLLNNNGDGHAYGADINMTKRLSRKYYGQIGYSYMVSKRNDHDGYGEYNFTFSQPHIVSLLGSYKPNDKWVFSSKFRYATGRPKDSYIVHENVLNDANHIRFSQEFTGKNDLRFTDFISWDIRVDYKIQVKKYSVTTFIDIVDILNRYNQSSELFQAITGKVYYDGLAIFPTFGVRIEM